MIHLIVLDTVYNGIATFVIENITTMYSCDNGTRIWNCAGNFCEVRESVDEITKRINQIVYGTDK